ncbi:MAG: cation:proton antiporter [Elusimicrobia bacterium]|nr:cation:proton antiporter [Elusimicrobiota bacterium]MDY6039366.1 cation:proton antiporter [Elusimicrobiaceae bacterium]
MTYTILLIGVLLFLGQVFSFLFEKTRLPDVLPLMLLGMLLGPVFHLAGPEDFGGAGQIFTTVALIVVLFKSGVDFRILSLRGAVGQGLLLTTVCFAVITLTTAFITQRALNIPQLYAFIIGAIVADNSTAVITPMLAKLQVSKTAKTVLFLEANLTGVYSIVLALALLSAASHGGQVSAAEISLRVVKSFGLGIVFSLAAGVFWMGILNKVRRLENAISLTFAFVLLVYSVSGLIGGDGAIATLAFGVVAGNTRLVRRLWLSKFDLSHLLSLNHGEKAFFDEVEFILKTLFFVYMGICMRIGRVDLLAIGFAVAFFKLVFRAPVVNYCVSKNVSRGDASVILAMCPNGLVSAVLAAMIASQLPEEGAVIQDVIYAVIFFSVLLSNLMSFRIEKGGLKWLGKAMFGRHKLDEVPAPTVQETPAALAEPSSAPEPTPGEAAPVPEQKSPAPDNPPQA